MRLPRRLARITRFAAKLILPALLVPAIIYGGASAEGFIAHAYILFGAGLCAASVLVFWDATRPAAGLGWPMGFLGAFVCLGLVHLVPLPTGFVLGLPGRDIIADGWALLAITPERTPLSMAPARTFAAIGAALIPLAAFLLVFRLGWGRATSILPWAIAGLGAVSGLYGFAQILSPDAGLYLYENTNGGKPVGFFANANHQVSFLLMTLPFTAALIGEARSKGLARDDERARLILAIALGLIQLVGVLAGGSTAGYLLLLPALFFSLLIMGSRKRTFSGRSSLVVALVLVASIVLVASSPVLYGFDTDLFVDREMSRFAMASTVLHALDDHIWLGSGIGTFEPVFRLYEDPMSVTSTYANHAHNEYLQWALETGLPGLLLLAGFLAWWLRKFFLVWSAVKDETARLRRAASVATLIIFLHSFVDYPARTPAILAFGSICLALMVLQRRQRAATTTDEVSGARQVTL